MGSVVILVYTDIHSGWLVILTGNKDISVEIHSSEKFKSPPDDLLILLSNEFFFIQ